MEAVAVLTPRKTHLGYINASLPANFMENTEGKSALPICFNSIFSGLAQLKAQKHKIH